MKFGLQFDLLLLQISPPIISLLLVIACCMSDITSLQTHQARDVHARVHLM